MKYKVLSKKISFQKNYYSLVPVRKKDIYLIIDWRNEQINILRQKRIISHQQQKKYYQNVIYPSFKQEKPSLILFSYLYKTKLIGYGGLTNLQWNEKKAEVSFLVDTKRAKNKKIYANDFGVFLELIKRIAFQYLDLNYIFTETYNIRPLHIKILEKNGFQKQKILKKHTLIGSKCVDSFIHVIFKEEHYV